MFRALCRAAGWALTRMFAVGWFKLRQLWARLHGRRLVRTVKPTGTVSMNYSTTQGIEPMFGPYQRRAAKEHTQE